VAGSNLARDLAEKLAGDFRYLAAPLIVSNEETAADLLSDRTIANTLTLARSAEVGIFGIGAIDSRVSGLVRAGYFTEDIVPALREQGTWATSSASSSTSGDGSSTAPTTTG